MKKILLMFSLMMLSTATVFAQEGGIQISTDKQTYYFGDFLKFTINVDNVTGDFAVIHIVDSSGKKSSPINLPISEKITTITAPNPFGAEIFGEGEYTLEVDYDRKYHSTKFFVKDSGKVVIPVWIKDLGAWWIEGLISDSEFAKGIEYLIESNVIVIQQQAVQENHESSIPDWFRYTTELWIQEDNGISDEEFANALAHLIKIGVIVINASDESEQT
ncbi:MAG: hypothetical protein DWQ18_07095 [Crenarchaeota archaeon]|nr:MAG: hypothetical protein DWQ17_02690 [Thermoproteota archaeon]RDJ32944.1 MAG: hypothetical protein DWQ18_07095 [Thermoproteota archaeon]RDJ35975.1 MAG: hypothetical protein DWQ13_08775 [Thermoproteota archaeon]RDJ38220.1 MAG: hypothetical protein DWQ19_00080 [Thermoproteota archaeon]